MDETAGEMARHSVSQSRLSAWNKLQQELSATLLENTWLDQRHQIYQHERTTPHGPGRSHTVKDAAGHLNEEPGNTWAEDTTRKTQARLISILFRGSLAAKESGPSRRVFFNSARAALQQTNPVRSTLPLGSALERR